MANREELDNEGHAELEKALETGASMLLSDEELPGGRYQVVGHVMGGEIILCQWRQDAARNWYAGNVVFLKRGTLPKLAELLRRFGYHLMAVPD